MNQILDKLFRLQQWFSGWAEAPLEAFLADPSSVQFQWIVPKSRSVYLADPFGTEGPDGRLLILAEKARLGMLLGQIVEVDTSRGSAWVRDPRNWRTLLAKPWHMSYPFVVTDGDDRFIVPEQAASNSISAYRLAGDNTVDPDPAWTVPDVAALDTTPFFHDGLWWIFSVRLGEPNWGGPLLLHMAEALDGPWRPHPMNPVVTDLSRARPGGRVAVVDGRLYRPSQDCSRVYGEALSISEITKLTPTEYEEHLVRRVVPSELGAPGASACHHLDSTGRYLLVDAMRYVTHPLAWFYKLRYDRYTRQVASQIPTPDYPPDL